MSSQDTKSSTTSSTIMPRKKPSILWFLAATLLLLVAIFAYQLFGPNPQIIVSRQTTFITAPLRPDGLPDYPEYLRRLYAANITPTQNAAVVLWQAVLTEETKGADLPLITQEIGLPSIPAKIDRIVPYYDTALTDDLWTWYCEEFNLDGPDFSGLNSSDTCDQIIEIAKSRPWKSDDMPPLSQWLDAHQIQLDLIVTASHQPKFYTPSPEWLRKSDLLLWETWPSGVNEFSFAAADRLSVRAMRSLGEGKFDEAWSDIRALFQLAHLLYQGHGTIEQIRGYMVENVALDATIEFLLSSKLSSDRARKARQYVETLQALPSLAPCVDQVNRISVLDAIMHLSAGESSKLVEALELSDNGQVIDIVRVDWNYVLRDVNLWFDRLVTALRSPDFSSRRSAIAALDGDLQRSAAPFENAAGLARISFSPTQRNQFLSLVAFEWLRNYVPVEEQTSVEARRGLAAVVAAITDYRSKHGNFPQSLNDIASTTPSDPFSTGSFFYRRDGDGYLIYSAGPNGADDGGSNYLRSELSGRQLNWNDGRAAQKQLQQIPSSADDIAIRLPRPPFKLPEPPTASDAE